MDFSLCRCTPLRSIPRCTDPQRYVIPGERGSLEPGQRALNYAWFYSMPESSPEYAAALTDIDGRRHRNTLPIGKMSPSVWGRQQEIAKRVLFAPHAELVRKTRQPFISSIRDCDVSKAAFFDGKLLLVGDAFTLFRPHFGASTNQGAMHALLLEKVLRGEINIQEWEQEVIEYARWMQALTNAVGGFFLYSWLGWLATILRLCFVWRPKTWGPWCLAPINARFKVLRVATQAAWTYLWL